MNNKKSRIFVFFVVSFLAVRTFCCPAQDFSDSAVKTLTLSDAVELALKNNAGLAIAAEKVSSAQYSVREAKTGKLPRLTLDMSVTRFQNTFSDLWRFPSSVTVPSLTADVNVLGVNVPITFPTFDITLPAPSNVTLSASTNFSNKFALKYPVYTGGKVESIISQAKLNEKIARLESEKLKQEITVNVTKAYYEVLKAKQFLLLAKENLENVKYMFKAEEAKFMKGKLSEYELMRVKTQIADAGQSVSSAETGYKTAKVVFVSFLGMDAGADVLLQYENASSDAWLQADTKVQSDGMPMDETLPMPNLPLMISYAIEHRTELQQLKLMQEVAKAQVKLANSNKMPNVGFMTAYDITGPQFPGLIRTLSATLAVSYPVFDFYETKWKKASAQSNVKQAELQEKELKNKISLDVTTSYLKLREAIQKRKACEPPLEEAEQAYAIAQSRFKMNAIPESDVQQTKLYLLRAKLYCLHALYDVKVSEAEFNKVLGK